MNMKSGCHFWRPSKGRMSVLNVVHCTRALFHEVVQVVQEVAGHDLALLALNQQAEAGPDFDSEHPSESKHSRASRDLVTRSHHLFRGTNVSATEEKEKLPPPPVSNLRHSRRSILGAAVSHTGEGIEEQDPEGTDTSAYLTGKADLHIYSADANAKNSYLYPGQGVDASVCTSAPSIGASASVCVIATCSRDPNLASLSARRGPGPNSNWVGEETQTGTRPPWTHGVGPCVRAFRDRLCQGVATTDCGLVMARGVHGVPVEIGVCQEVLSDPEVAGRTRASGATGIGGVDMLSLFPQSQSPLDAVVTPAHVHAGSRHSPMLTKPLTNSLLTAALACETRDVRCKAISGVSTRSGRGRGEDCRSRYEEGLGCIPVRTTGGKGRYLLHHKYVYTAWRATRTDLRGHPPLSKAREDHVKPERELDLSEEVRDNRRHAREYNTKLRHEGVRQGGHALSVTERALDNKHQEYMYGLRREPLVLRLAPVRLPAEPEGKISRVRRQDLDHLREIQPFIHVGSIPALPTTVAVDA
ncbi:hypothetical protein C8R43DRAFT_955227 [Mycena crocata]|nr:hypothetical protein C8R43DRAFT_955227 [Mycena crocata]